MRSESISYETKQFSSSTQVAYRETRGFYPAHKTSPHIKNKGRNASIFGLDINITSGEPAQGKTGLFGSFEGFVLRGKWVYFHKQRHHLHKHRSCDPVLFYIEMLFPWPETCSQLLLFLFRLLKPTLTCSAAVNVSCYYVLIVGSSSYKLDIIIAPLFRQCDLISIWRSHRSHQCDLTLKIWQQTHHMPFLKEIIIVQCQVYS